MKHSILLILMLSFAQFSTAGTASRIVDKAKNYRANMKKVTRKGRQFTQLYRYIIDDKLTRYGRWGCATVVSTTLNAAGVRIRLKYSVRNIESALKRWKKVKTEGAMKPGDVIVWHKRGHDRVCSGGGDCHVGIYLGNGRVFENDPMWSRPAITSLRRSRWIFKNAFRPRN